MFRNYNCNFFSQTPYIQFTRRSAVVCSGHKRHAISMTRFWEASWFVYVIFSVLTGSQ